MYKGLEKNIVEQVKRLVGVTGDISPFKLYDLLYIRWKTLQLVKTTDEEIRRVTDEKLSELNTLLEQLFSYIQQEHVRQVEAAHHP